MNKFLAKLMAVILIGLLAVTGILCLIGFTIGGHINLIHILLFVLASVICALAAGFVLFKNEKGKLKTAVITAFIIFFCFFYSGYSVLNSLSKGNGYVEYKSTVTCVDARAKQVIFEDVYFTDNEGNEACKTVFQTIVNDKYEEDVPIDVKQWQGGFGYPVYEIKVAEENNES